MPLTAIDDLAPWRNRSFEQAQFGMGHNQFGIDFLLCAQTGTGGTGTMRAVEAKGARRDFRQADVIIGAGQFLGVQNLFTIDDRNQHDTTTKFQGRQWQSVAFLNSRSPGEEVQFQSSNALARPDR